MKFNVICDSCRYQIAHKATVEQEKRLLKTLSLSFECSNCRRPVHVTMGHDGSVVSMSIQDALAKSIVETELIEETVEPEPALPEFLDNPAEHRAPVPKPAFQNLDTPEESPNHVPFSPLPEESSPRKKKTGLVDRFSDWFNNLPLLGQWAIILPLIFLAIAILWDPPAENPAERAESQEPDLSDGSEQSTPNRNQDETQTESADSPGDAPRSDTDDAASDPTTPDPKRLEDRQPSSEPKTEATNGAANE